jgi:hypothetical protein
MGDHVDQDSQHKEIDTEATWKAHNEQLAKIMGIPDPCGTEKGYGRILALYLKLIMLVVNLRNIKCLLPPQSVDMQILSTFSFNFEDSTHWSKYPTPTSCQEFSPMTFAMS